MSTALPAFYFRLVEVTTGDHLEPTPRAIIFGIGILGAAFLISWVAEAAEMDIPQTLALAVLALIAVLPEYAVDLYFAWTAPEIPENRHFAVANMTGGNRLLIGLGWPVVFFLFWWTTKRKTLSIDRGHALELTFLAIATLYSFTIPIKGHLSLLDTVILVSLFGAYIFFASRRPTEEPELLGPAKLVGSFPMISRRILLFVLFLFAGSAIFASAEPFAEGLIEIGEEFGISQFLLVQWLAPLASESPEFIIASLFVLRGRAGPAMGALISSKVNQWTLLIGSLPLAFAISGGSLSPLDFDSRQSEEILLTAAQSAFAVAVFLSLSISRWEALLLAALFGTQLFFTDTTVRLVYSFVYIVLAVGLLFYQRNEIMPLLRSAREAARGGPPLERDPMITAAGEETFPEDSPSERADVAEQPSDGRRRDS